MSAEYYADEYSFLPGVSNEDYITSPNEYTGYGVGNSGWTPGGASGLGALLSRLGTGALNFAQSDRGIATILGMLLGGLQGKQPERGGINLNLSPAKVTKEIAKGRYGPISLTKFAADGGLMQAYATGGVITGTHKNPMQMEDGGFVLTADAVRNGTPQGIQKLLPQAQLIRGPGTGTSDHIPATIAGRTPARVSNGEMYVPKAQVDAAGGAPALYALMRQLQRRA